MTGDWEVFIKYDNAFRNSDKKGEISEVII